MCPCAWGRSVRWGGLGMGRQMRPCAWEEIGVSELEREFTK